MKKLILYSSFFLLFASSCNVAQPVFISYDNLRVNELNDTVLQFSMDTYAYNPTRLNYQLTDLIFDINYDQKPIGNGKLVSLQHVKAKDTVLLPLRGYLNLKTLQKKHKQILAQDTVDFYFIGKAFAVHPLKKLAKSFEIRIPYDIKKFVSANMLSKDLVFSQIEIKKINPFKNINPFKSNFSINVKIYNKQPFDFEIKKMEISLKSQHTDKVVLEGVLDTIINAPSMETIEIPLDIATNNLNLLRNLGSFFLGENSTKYIGIGSITIRIKEYDFQIPFLQEFDIKTNPIGSIKTSSKAISNRCTVKYLNAYTPTSYGKCR